MAKKIPMCVCILLLTTPVCHALTFGEFLAGAVGVAAAPFVIPAAPGAAGFTAIGIAAGAIGIAGKSIGGWAGCAAYRAIKDRNYLFLYFPMNGSPVATGSVVAIAQSIGATGAIGLAGKAIGGGAAYAAYRTTRDRD